MGLVRTKMDIKLLILYILDKLPCPVDSDSLMDLCSFDDGVGYFDFADCLHELTETGQVISGDDGFAITDGGKSNIGAVYDNLPYSVRLHADGVIAAEKDSIGRAANITAGHWKDDNGGVRVHLSLSDGISPVIDMTLLCSDEAQARRIKKNFRRKAESFYSDFISQLTE